MGVVYSFGKQGLVGCVVLFSVLACREFSRLIPDASKTYRYTFITVTLIHFGLFAFVYKLHYFGVFSGLFAFIFLSVLAIARTDKSIDQRVRTLALSQVGVVYCGTLAGLVTQGCLLFGIHFYALLFFVSFGTDTFAYIGGKLMGKNKLTPLISPNKTIEGSLCGLLGGTALGMAYTLYFSNHPNHSLYPNSPPNWMIALLGCLFASGCSQVGDLFESLTKRHSGVKDSGRLLPGHGGVLDRVDGLLFAAPFIYLIFLYQYL